MAHRTWMWSLCSLLFFLLAGGSAAGKEQVLTREKVEAALHRIILQRGPWQPEEIEVRVSSFTPLSLPPGRVNFRVLKPQRGITPGFRSFLLEVIVEGKEQTRVWVRSEIRVIREVVVISRPLARYQVISAEDVRLEKRDVSSLTIRAITEIDESIGKRATRAIGVNEILTSSMAELPKVVRRGNTVSMIYESFGLKAETRGRALEGGRVGDIIRVKNLSSGKALEGLILDTRTVRVNW